VRCDIFCRVIDNFGDIGVCWRLARELGSRGIGVRLHVDDASALVWMAPRGARNVEVRDWKAAHAGDVADLVIEAFGCDPPPDYLSRMAATTPPPCWINLEYLSAQAYVERSHGLPSPQLQGPARALVKHFFYPGFTSGTGGLLREVDLLRQVDGFARDAWLHDNGWARRPGEQVVVLFGYRNPALPQLLDRLASEPTLLLLAQGPAREHALEVLQRRSLNEALRTAPLPYLSQDEFDRLLWSADLSFVRGEDSLVRALWAGAPFVWQIYPQSDDAHHDKLETFLDRLLETAPAALESAVRSMFRWWNAGLPASAERPTWPDARAWRTQVHAWRNSLAGQSDLVTQLLRFVAARR